MFKWIMPCKYVIYRTNYWLYLLKLLSFSLRHVIEMDQLIFLQCLSRALRNENPKLLMAASALCLPFQPLMVSAVHTGIMEVTFKIYLTTVRYQFHDSRLVSPLSENAVCSASDR